MSFRPTFRVTSSRGRRSRTAVGERVVLALAVASQASVSICSWGLGALVPDLADEFALSGAQIGLVIAASSISTALVLVPAGALVDRLGPRRPLLVSAVLATAFLAAAAEADGVIALMAAFLGFGVCQAVITLAGAVSIFQTFEESRRGTAMGVRQMAVSLGGLVAAGLLPGLAAVGGVRLALLTSAVLAGICSLAFGLVSPRVPAGARRGVPDLPELLRRPGMVRTLVLSACYVVSLSAVLGFAVAALRDQSASVRQGSALFVVISLAAMAARLVWGRLADLRGPDGATRRWQVLAVIWVVLTVGALGYWAVTPWGPAAQLPMMGLFAFGALGANGVLQLIAGEASGPGRAGQGVGLASMVLFGGAALVSPVHGWIADQAGYRSLWLVCAACGVLCLLITMPMLRTQPPSAR